MYDGTNIVNFKIHFISLITHFLINRDFMVGFQSFWFTRHIYFLISNELNPWFFITKLNWSNLTISRYFENVLQNIFHVSQFLWHDLILLQARDHIPFDFETDIIWLAHFICQNWKMQFLFRWRFKVTYVICLRTGLEKWKDHCQFELDRLTIFF